MNAKTNANRTRQINAIRERRFLAVRDNQLAEIARRHLDLETLETQRTGADFREQGVWCIKQALIAAYEAGKADATLGD